ncbi:MAG: hypothetical protein HQL74_15945 [Magnetococcales bacterium]|nr:hypothetical protein [Magnetococcales bacterium]
MKRNGNLLFLVAGILAIGWVQTAIAGPPIIVGPGGRFLGTLSSNGFDPNSVSNPYGQYGSQYSPDSINNPYGQYGSQYSPNSINNPYASTPPSILSNPYGQYGTQ